MGECGVDITFDWGVGAYAAAADGTTFEMGDVWSDGADSGWGSVGSDRAVLPTGRINTSSGWYTQFYGGCGEAFEKRTGVSFGV